jgi:hypothetical protein
MTRHLALAGLIGLLALTAASRAADKAGAKDNTPPPGFKALFNGKDLTNWQGLIPINERAKMTPEARAARQKEADKAILPHWKVEDGVIHYDGKADSLQTVKDYGDFELFVDWKIKEKGDSGIYVRGTPQIQIWDSDSLTGGLAVDKGTGSGGLWNNAAGAPGKTPLKKADKPIGEWNTFHITMKGDKVTVVLNGETVVKEAPLANYWDRGKPLPTAGPIELQHHGDELWFKNIYIKELSK